MSQTGGNGENTDVDHHGHQDISTSSYQGEDGGAVASNFAEEPNSAAVCQYLQESAAYNPGLQAHGAYCCSLPYSVDCDNVQSGFGTTTAIGTTTMNEESMNLSGAVASPPVYQGSSPSSIQASHPEDSYIAPTSDSEGHVGAETGHLYQFASIALAADQRAAEQLSGDGDSEKVYEEQLTVDGYPASLVASQITVQIDEFRVWTELARLGAEMIVTKAGRRIFPPLAFSVKGLEPNSTYSIKLQLKEVDEKKYKYDQDMQKWMAFGRAEVHDEEKMTVMHDDGACSGIYWMKKLVSFKSSKMTNNPRCKKKYMLVSSMQKYVPIFTITLVKDSRGTTLPIERRVEYTFSFDVTTFITVTAYHNDAVTQLKVDRNPYAKSFREGEGDYDHSPSVVSPYQASQYLSHTPLAPMITPDSGIATASAHEDNVFNFPPTNEWQHMHQYAAYAAQAQAAGYHGYMMQQMPAAPNGWQPQTAGLYSVMDNSQYATANMYNSQQAAVAGTIFSTSNGFDAEEVAVAETTPVSSPDDCMQ